MAKNDADKKEGGNTGQNKKWIIIGIVSFNLIALAAGAYYVLFVLNPGLVQGQNLGARDPNNAAQLAANQKKLPRYVELGEEFVITMPVKDSAEFIQIGISALTYFDDTELALKENIPIIRNSIILNISGKKSSNLKTQKGKDKLREELLTEIENILKNNTEGGVMDVEQLFFTKFVMQ